MEKYTRIKEVMREKSTTSYKTAEKMNVSIGTLSGIINGNPTISTLAKIADTLDVELKELIR